MVKRREDRPERVNDIGEEDSPLVWWVGSLEIPMAKNIGSSST